MNPDYKFIEKTKLGYRIYFLGLGFWFIKNERRISVFCDKKSLFLHLIPRKFWTQYVNTSVAQRSIKYPNVLLVF